MPRFTAIGLAPEVTILRPPRTMRLGEDGGGSGAVAGDVVGLRRDLLGELGAHVLEGVFEFDFAGDGDAVLGDARGAVFLIDDDVAAARAERHLHGVGEGIDAILQPPARRLIEQQLLGNHVILSF